RNREPARPWGASGRARRTTPDDVTRHALSYVWNLAPIIHPLPQPPPAAIVYQRASVEVTLSFRENSPHSRRPQKTRNRVAIVGRRRHRRAVRGVFLQRTRGDVSALERRIQFFEPRLSSRFRIRGGLGLGHRWFRSTRGSGRDGFRGIRQIGASRRPAAGTC